MARIVCVNLRARMYLNYVARYSIAAFVGTALRILPLSSVENATCIAGDGAKFVHSLIIVL